MNFLVSSSVNKTIKESAQFAKKMNLGLEISRIPLYKTENMTVQDVIDALKADLDGFSNLLTFHAMFSDVNISSADYELRAISRKRFIQSFEIAKAIGASTVLFHSGYKGTKHYGSIYSFKKKFVEFWSEFIKEFEKAGMTAVVENVFEDSPDFCIDLYEKISNNNFKLALDVGHINLYAKNTKIENWIEKYGLRLYHMHIHNNFGGNDDHSNLLKGMINYKDVFEVIEQKGLNPSIVFEMFSEEDVISSLNYLKNL